MYFLRNLHWHGVFTNDDKWQNVYCALWYHYANSTLTYIYIYTFNIAVQFQEHRFCITSQYIFHYFCIIMLRLLMSSYQDYIKTQMSHRLKTTYTCFSKPKPSECAFPPFPLFYLLSLWKYPGHLSHQLPIHIDKLEVYTKRML